MNGVVVLNKPKGKTSHDMVYLIRRLFKIRRVGHTGTLDPNATGVLPVCIGSATKAASYIQDSKKRYRAELILGSRTDTLDCTGEVVATGDASGIERDMLEAVCKGFVGDIEQIPPMYSAVKINGRRLYELAREGKEVERKSRSVSIYAVDIVEFDDKNKRAILDVECSKGTYIRTLCDDIGASLGCFAHMGELVRTYSGGFSIEQSYGAEELERMCESGTLADAVIKTEDIYKEFGQIFLNENDSFKVKNGVSIEKNDAKEGKNYRIYDENGEFLCVSKKTDGRLKMTTSFWG